MHELLTSAETYQRYNNMLIVLNKFEPYYIMIIIILGVIGNTISFLLFTLTKLKLNPANILLAALAFADNWFLISLTVVTLKHININIDILAKSAVLCKLTAYSTFLSSFLSVWFIVAFSIQRCIVVYFPLKRYDFCNKSKTKKIIIVLVMFSLIFYSYTLFTSGLDEKHDNSCVTLDSWFLMVKVLILVDTVQTMIVPFIIISITNVLIALKLMEKFTVKKTSSNSSNHLKSLRRSSSNNLRRFEITDADSFSISFNNEQNKNMLKQSESCTLIAKHIKSSNNRETTKTLLIIASTFLLLNFPIASTKTFYFFTSNTESIPMPVENSAPNLMQQYYQNFTNSNFNYTRNHTQFFLNLILNMTFESSAQLNETSTNYVLFDSEKTSYFSYEFVNKTSFIDVLNNEVIFNQKKELFERVASLIYYINFSINFLLYTFNTKQFREIFFHLFKHSKG